MSSNCARTLDGLEVGLALEIGPPSTLGSAIAHTGPAPAPVVLPTLPSPSQAGHPPDSDGTFLAAVARAYEAGMNISFAGLFAGETRSPHLSPHLSLPTQTPLDIASKTAPPHPLPSHMPLCVYTGVCATLEPIIPLMTPPDRLPLPDIHMRCF